MTTPTPDILLVDDDPNDMDRHPTPGRAGPSVRDEYVITRPADPPVEPTEGGSLAGRHLAARIADAMIVERETSARVLAERDDENSARLSPPLARRTRTASVENMISQRVRDRYERRGNA